MNGLKATKATTSTSSISSSRSPSTPNTQNRTSHLRSRNSPPVVTSLRHGASKARPSSSASAISSDTSSIPPTRRVANIQRTNETTLTIARPVHRRQNGLSTTFNRAAEAQRLSPPHARSDKHHNTTALTTRLNPARHAASDSPRVTGTPGSHANAKTRTQELSQSSSLASSTRSSPAGSDDEKDDEEEEEGLFVSPPDTTKIQATAPNSRALGVRGFANMPLPRDQESDEEDLRPSHVLRQERRAAAGKPEKPIGRKDKDGRLYDVNGSDTKIYGAPLSVARASFSTFSERKKSGKSGKSTRSASSRSNDSDDNFDIDGSELSSSNGSFEGTPQLDRRSKNRDNARHSNSHRHRSYNNSGPPRTPSPNNDGYCPYEVYGPDLDSPPPSYLIKSPGVIDRTLPYPDREENKFLSDVAQVQPDDLFDADDIFFTFQGQTPHEIQVQARLDAEKEAMQANAYGSGFRAPMHFDHCPYTAPICRGERETWIAERKRIDTTKARDDCFEDVERLLRIDRDAYRHITSNSGTPVSSVLTKGKRATCAGPARVKRKYNWRDPDMKNKRRRRGITRGAQNSRSRGEAQVDGVDERVDTEGPSWAWSEAAGAVVNIREPITLLPRTRPTSGSTRSGGALPSFGYRASNSFDGRGIPAPPNISDASIGFVGREQAATSGISGTFGNASAVAGDNNEAGIDIAPAEEPAVVGNSTKTGFVPGGEESNATGPPAENNDFDASLSRPSSS
ncbi:581ee51f-0c39-490b-85c4-2568314f2cb0-CDS [Sclerotinia trifoliorum]|uniref:581ee51f-0c39-490b-85c4-2568314f2cb0-CDS n=1 Tax=Sclerotinia trifoliorum TaxID=28548 RepID=A0A8H2VYR7_9HELO|nr:581ee51f-0c39-490b-85c4-2568314f2cb0-CDS [Sclerotinia trifoliorum]